MSRWKIFQSEKFRSFYRRSQTPTTQFSFTHLISIQLKFTRRAFSIFSTACHKMFLLAFFSQQQQQSLHKNNNENKLKKMCNCLCGSCRGCSSLYLCLTAYSDSTNLKYNSCLVARPFHSTTMLEFTLFNYSVARGINIQSRPALSLAITLCVCEFTEF